MLFASLRNAARSVAISWNIRHARTYPTKAKSKSKLTWNS